MAPSPTLYWSFPKFKSCGILKSRGGSMSVAFMNFAAFLNGGKIGDVLIRVILIFQAF